MVVFVRSLAMLVAMPFASEGSDSEGATRINDDGQVRIACAIMITPARW